MKHRKLIAGILLATLILSAFIPFLGPLVKADSKASRTTVSKAGQIVTCYDDGTFLDDRGLVTLGSSYRNIRTGLKFEGFNNISKSSRIDSATLRIYYYTGTDFNTTTEAQLLIEAIKDGAPEFLTWDGVVNGWDTDHITWFNMSWLNASGYYDITLNPDMIQELVLSSPWLHDDTPENGSIVLRTWNTAPVGPGFQRYHYEIPTGEPSLSNLRPTLTITYTPGIYDDGYIIDTPAGGNGTYHLFGLIYDQTNPPESMRILSSANDNFTGAVEYNLTTTKAEYAQYAVNTITQSGNASYYVDSDNPADYMDIWRIRPGEAPGLVARIDMLGSTHNGVGLATDAQGLIHIAYSQGLQVLYATYDPVTNISQSYGNMSLPGNRLLRNNYDVYTSISAEFDSIGRFWVSAVAGTNVTSNDHVQAVNVTAGDRGTAWYSPTSLGLYPRINFIDDSVIVSEMVDWDDYNHYLYNESTHIFDKQGATKKITTGTYGANRLDWMAGKDELGADVLVTFFCVSNTGYQVGYESSYDLGVTVGAEQVTVGLDPPLHYSLRMASDNEGRIYVASVINAVNEFDWGLYEDHVDNRTNLIRYDSLATDDITAITPQRHLFQTPGAGGNTTYTPFEPDPPIPGFNETCVDRQLRITFGAGPYNESEIQQAIDYCEDWVPGNSTDPDPLTSGISKKSFKLYYLVIGTASIVIPWLLYAFTSDPEYIGWILLLNALGLGLLIEFIRL